MPSTAAALIGILQQNFQNLNPSMIEMRQRSHQKTACLRLWFGYQLSKSHHCPYQTMKQIKNERPDFHIQLWSHQASRTCRKLKTNYRRRGGGPFRLLENNRNIYTPISSIKQLYIGFIRPNTPKIGVCWGFDMSSSKNALRQARRKGRASISATDCKQRGFAFFRHTKQFPFQALTTPSLHLLDDILDSINCLSRSIILQPDRYATRDSRSATLAAIPR